MPISKVGNPATNTLVDIQATRLERVLPAAFGGDFTTAASAFTYKTIDAIDWVSDGRLWVSSNGGYRLYAWANLDSTFDPRNTEGRVELTPSATVFSGGLGSYISYSLLTLFPTRHITLGFNNLAAGSSVSRMGYLLKAV